jgi:Effector-associated domain 11
MPDSPCPKEVIREHIARAELKQAIQRMQQCPEIDPDSLILLSARLAQAEADRDSHTISWADYDVARARAAQSMLNLLDPGTRIETNMRGLWALLLGIITFTWQLPAIVHVQRRHVWSMIGYGAAYPSEVVIISVLLLPLLLIPLHVMLHRHQRALARPAACPWFPRLPQLDFSRRARLLFFVFLVLGPTAVQVFWVSRLFDDNHLFMVEKGARQNRYHSFELLSRCTATDGSVALPFDSNWAWEYCYDVRSIMLEKGWTDENTTSLEREELIPIVSMQAIPVVTPWWALLTGLFLCGSQLWLLVRGVRVIRR